MFVINKKKKTVIYENLTQVWSEIGQFDTLGSRPLIWPDLKDWRLMIQDPLVYCQPEDLNPGNEIQFI